MGYVKEMIERLGGGYPPDPDISVCAGCFEDKGLKDFIKGSAGSTSCSFGGTKSDEQIT